MSGLSMTYLMTFIAEDHESVYDIVSCNLVILRNYEFIQVSSAKGTGF